MPLPSQADLLAAWESGAGSPGPVARALTLLALALPDREPDMLGTISIGARDRALLRLREAVFGPRLTGLAQCGQCGEALELDCAVAELCAPEPREGPLVVATDGYALTLRQPSSVDLLEAMRAPAHDVETVLLARCITEVTSDGVSVTATSLPPPVVDAAARRLAEADPQADMRLSVTCPGCGAATAAPFDIAAFLWSELEALSHRLLGEVHTLASAYGWSERAILDLSPLRRRYYIAMVQA